MLQFFYDIYLFIIGAQETEETVIVYVEETFVICDWLGGRNLDGSGKRFSIGELVVGQIVILAATNILTYALFGFDILALILTNSMAMGIFMSVFLTFYENYAYLCSPSIPLILPDDILYFLAYNLFPKCSWFWGFMIKSLYNNDNCYTCEAAKAYVLTHCVHEVGFLDFTYNVAFIFDVFFPDFINSLRTDTGVGRLIIDFGPISDRLGHWAGINIDDPFLWARYQGCNWIVTLPVNIGFFSLFAIGAAILLLPFTGVVGSVLSYLSDFLWETIVIIFYLLNEISMKINNIILFSMPPLPSLPVAATVDDDPGSTATPSSPLSKHLGKKQKRSKLEKGSTFDLKGVSNFLSLAKDNLIGDRKDK